MMLPSVLFLVLSFYVPDKGLFYLALLIFIAVLDSGHIYLTIYRASLERTNNFMEKKYIITPIIIFSGLFFWKLFKAPYLWSFIVYITVFHNLRQFFGINRWYQHINNNKNPRLDKYVYSICCLSFLGFHFRSDVKIVYYTKSDIFLFPNSSLENYIKLCLAVLFLFLAKDIYKLWKNKVSLAQINSVVLPTVLYAVSLLYGKNELQILGSIILSHAITYIAVVYKSLSIKNFLNLNKKTLALLMLCTAGLFGLFEFYLEENYIDHNSNTLTMSLLTAVYLTPLLSHFIFDSWLWKKSNVAYSEILKAC